MGSYCKKDLNLSRSSAKSSSFLNTSESTKKSTKRTHRKRKNLSINPPSLKLDRFKILQTAPLSPAVALNLLENYLSDTEKAEILQFPSVYYVDSLAKTSSICYDDREGNLMMFKGNQLAYRYSVIDLLGKGVYGVVYRALDHKLKVQVAVKIVKNAPAYTNRTTTEVNLLQTVAHPNLITYQEHFVFRNHVCIVFELLGESLFDDLKLLSFKGMPLAKVRNIMRQVLLGLCYLKNQGVIHSDLKPENILFTDSQKHSVKVIDFGSASFDIENGNLPPYVQSRYYRAPEVLLGIPYSNAIDMWSFGCILYEVRKGQPLFPGSNEKKQIHLIVEAIGMPPQDFVSCSKRRHVFFDENARFSFQRSLQVLMHGEDPVFSDLLQKCLQWKPQNRITPAEAADHLFFSKL